MKIRQTETFNQNENEIEKESECLILINKIYLKNLQKFLNLRCNFFWISCWLKT